jgi:hypothetical protein
MTLVFKKVYARRKIRSDAFQLKFPEVVSQLDKFYVSKTFSEPSAHETVKQCCDNNNIPVHHHKDGHCTKYCKVETRHAMIMSWNDGLKYFNENILKNITTKCDKVSPQIFRAFAPWYLRLRNYHSCICTLHQEGEDMINAMHEYCNKCNCAICKDIVKETTKSEFRKSTRTNMVCKKFLITCINGNCNKCGVTTSSLLKKFAKCTGASDPETRITLNGWKTVTLKNGKSGKVRDEKSLKFDEYVEKLKAFLPTYLKHHIQAQLNQEAFDIDISTVEEDECVLLADFQMNLSHTYANTVQSEHWTKTQTTIFPVIAYIKINGIINCISIPVISNDILHDNAFVELAIGKAINYIETTYKITIKSLTLWSDGCAAQFKNKNQFLKLSKSARNFRHRFFASGHGKGPSDSEGAVVKHCVSEALRRGMKIYTPLIAYIYMQNNLEVLSNKHKIKGKERKANEVDARHFIYISEEEISRPEAPEITGLASQVKCNHHFENTGAAGTIIYTSTCCSCNSCIAQWQSRRSTSVSTTLKCKNIHIIGKPTITKLTPKSQTSAAAAVIRLGDKELMERAEARRRSLRSNIGNFYFIFSGEDGDICMNESKQSLFLCRLIEAPRKFQSGDKVNKRIIGKKWYWDQNIGGKHNHFVVKIQWYKGKWDGQLNTFVYTPEYLPKYPGRKKVEMIPAETYIWETMLRTHRRERNVQCPPLTIINVPYDKKTIKRIDRPIQIKPREIQLVIVNCKRDEGMYLKQSDGY